MKWLEMAMVRIVGACGGIFAPPGPRGRLSWLWTTALVLLVTACGDTQDSDKEVSESTRVAGEHSFGPSTEPWETPPQDWTPVVVTDGDFGEQVQTLSQEKPRFSHRGVELALMPEFVNEPVEVRVNPVKLPPPRKGAQANAYDFSMSAAPSDLGVMEITIPYPDGESITGDTVIGAGYFNEATESWEPVAFEIDEEKEQVVISTTHMSIFSCFRVTGKGKRYARISGIFAVPSSVAQDRYDEVLVEAINNNLTPGKEALELGLGITNDALGFSGALLNLSALQSSLGYNTIFTENLSGILGDVGSAAALVQMAVDYERRDEKQTKLLGNAIKNITNYMVSRFGSSLLNAAYVSVFAIDYSLGKLIETTIEDRKGIWANAYRMYYEEKANRSTHDWYEVLEDIQEDSRNPEEFKSRFEEKLDDYVRLFWEEKPTTIAIYQDRAQKRGFTAFGGMKLVKDEISREFRKELLTGPLKAAFNRLEKEHKIQQEKQYEKRLEDLSAQLNRKVVLTIREESEGDSARYGGYYLRLGPLNQRADPEQWTGRLNPKGRLVANFTVLGHLQSGAPKEISLYPDRNALDQDDPEFTVEFSVDVPETEVILEPDSGGTGRWSLVTAQEAAADPLAPNLERTGMPERMTSGSDEGLIWWGMPAEDIDIARGPTYSFDVEAEAGELRTLTAWKEPVHDAEGRRQEVSVELRTTRRWSPSPPRTLEPGATLEMTEQMVMEAAPADLYVRGRYKPELSSLMKTSIDRQPLGRMNLDADELRDRPIELTATHTWQVPTGNVGERMRIRLSAEDSGPEGLGQGVAGGYIHQLQWVHLLYVYEYEE